MRSRRVEQAPVSLFSFQDIVTSVMGIMILVMLVIALELAARQLQTPAAAQHVVREEVEAALAQAQQRLRAVQAALRAGQWDDLAALSPSDLARQTTELERLLPVLTQEAERAERRLAAASAREAQARQALARRRPDESRLAQMQEQLAELQAELAQLATSSRIFYRPSDTGGKAVWLVELSSEAVVAARLGPVARPLSFAGSTPASRHRQFLAWAKDRQPAQEYFVLLVKPGGTEYHALERALRDRGFQVGLDLLGSQQMAIDPERGAPVFESAGGGRP